MSSIMGPIGQKQLELFALELGKIAALYFYSLASTNIINHTKLGHNVYEHKTSVEFDYGSSHTRSGSVVCP